MLTSTQRRPAQTLLEGILAITVILTATFGSTTLIVTTISAGGVSADKIQAANFAREGVEVVRFIRDSNWMKRAQNVVDDCVVSCGGTIVQWDDSGLTTDGHKPLSGDYIAKFDPTSGESSLVISTDKKIYTFTGYMSQECSGACTSQETKFSRTINITTPDDTFFSANDAKYLLVTSTVSWENHGAKSLQVTERLYDWR